MSVEPAVWFPLVRTGTGTDVFTRRLVEGLSRRDLRAEITWLPLRAEYASLTVNIPEPPRWATVVHVNTWLPPRFLPRHLPLVATVHHAMHHPDVKAYKGFVRAAYHRFWIASRERRVLRRADHAVAVSQFVAETTKRYLLDVPMDVIHNGVDTEGFRPGNRRRRPGEPFRLLYVGGWKKLKGVDLLAPIMRALGNGFELRYTGSGASKEDKQEMPPNMYDIGRLQGEDDVITAMRDADALLFPTRSEGFGLVAVEAMACGLPVIAAHGSSLDEVVEDGVTGLLCPSNDVKRFACACRNLADDGDLVSALSCAARDRALTRFSAMSMLDHYINIYRRLTRA